MKLRKHTIVIWSKVADDLDELEDLVEAAERGAAYVDDCDSVDVEDPHKDPAWAELTAFFGKQS